MGSSGNASPVDGPLWQSFVSMDASSLGSVSI